MFSSVSPSFFSMNFNHQPQKFRVSCCIFYILPCHIFPERYFLLGASGCRTHWVNLCWINMMKMPSQTEGSEILQQQQLCVQTAVLLLPSAPGSHFLSDTKASLRLHCWGRGGCCCLGSRQALKLILTFLPVSACTVQEQIQPGGLSELLEDQSEAQF